MTDSVQQLLEKAQAAAERAQQMAQQAQHYSDQIAQAAAVISGHASGGGMIYLLFSAWLFSSSLFLLAIMLSGQLTRSPTHAPDVCHKRNLVRDCGWGLGIDWR